MRIQPDCVACLTRQAQDTIRLLTPDETLQARVLREAEAVLADRDEHLAPPEIARQIQRHVRAALRNDDPYRAIKERSNALALRLYPDLSARVAGSHDPFETAVRLAIAGNIIDYAVAGEVADSQVERTLAFALGAPVDHRALAELRRAVAAADRILYLADNAGEIVLDRLLIEQFPREKVTVVVRGGPAINDATRADARAAGLDERVAVIDNGSDVPGTVLAQCSPEFRSAFAAADVVISKGQGNFETLGHAREGLFYLLMAKCPAVARALGCEVGSLQIRRA